MKTMKRKIYLLLAICCCTFVMLTACNATDGDLNDDTATLTPDVGLDDTVTVSPEDDAGDITATVSPDANNGADDTNGIEADDDTNGVTETVSPDVDTDTNNDATDTDNED